MQKRLLTLLAAAAGSVLLATSTAQAMPVFDIIWESTGSDEIDIGTAPATSLVQANIVMTSDQTGAIGTGAFGLSAVFISLTYDATELAYVKGAELLSIGLPGMGNAFAPVTPGVDTATSGRILKFDLVADTGLYAADGPRTLGSIVFHVVNPVADGLDDVIVAIDNPGIDVLGVGSIAVCTVEGEGVGTSGCVFNGARIPEPTTAVLVIAGIAGLGWASRRSIG